jgi:hypothetical protein
VPTTIEPAEAVPVDDAAVLLAIKSATNCIRFVFRVELYVTAILIYPVSKALSSSH